MAGDSDAARLLADQLITAGYETRTAESVQAAMRQVLRGWPDVVVCVPFGDDDGATVVRRICASFAGPILAIGPTHAPEAAVPILDAGADDYVSDRITLPELLARIRARVRHVRRLHGASPRDGEAVSGLHLDPEYLTASFGGRRAHLSPREMAILRVLSLQPGKMVETGYLVSEIWGVCGPSEETILRTYVKFLRRKLERLLGDRTTVVCVRGRGYRLDLPPDAPITSIRS